VVLRQTVMATHHSAQTSKTREAAALPKSAYGASRPLARVPAKVPSLNAPAVTQTWWCEPLLMPRCGRWCRSPPSRRRSAITTAASRLAARPICCRACATISVPTLIVASTRRARSTRAESRTARKSRTASPLRQVIPPPRPDLRAFLDFIQVHRRDQYRSHQELSAPANNRWLSGCAVARAGFPCAL